MYNALKTALTTAIYNEVIYDVNTTQLTQQHIINESVRGRMTGDQARELLELLACC